MDCASSLVHLRFFADRLYDSLLGIRAGSNFYSTYSGSSIMKKA